VNTIHVSGNAGAAAEHRSTQSGKRIAEFRIAVWQGDSDPSMWLGVTVWHNGDKPGRAWETATRVKKGDRVIVAGRLKMREYEARDGTKRQAWEIVASEVAIEQRPPQAEGRPASFAQQRARPEAQQPTPPDASTWDADDDVPW
jgi:single-strand DNA-binding protein